MDGRTDRPSFILNCGLNMKKCPGYGQQGEQNQSTVYYKPGNLHHAQ